MKTPNWLKILWWVVLIGITSGILLLRYNAIILGKSVPFDILVFIVWVALMSTPLFQEIIIFGIKLKQSIDELKSQINEVKNEISNKNTFKPTIKLTPTSDNKIQGLEEKYSKTLDAILITKGINPVEESKLTFNVPASNQFLFATKFRIVNELRRIWENSIYQNQEKRRTPVIQILKNLTEHRIIYTRHL